MKEDSAELVRKNNISANLFLAAAVLSGGALAFFVYVFILIFAGIKAVFSFVAAADENGFFLNEAWQLYLVLFVALIAVILQFAAFGLMKMHSRYARPCGIAAFFLTILMFTPVALLLIYPFAFLVGNNGKYFYRHLVER